MTKKPQGWKLYAHPLFHAQLDRLSAQLEGATARDPEGYIHHPVATLLKTIDRYVLEIVPRDPNAAEFRQGKTLGPGNKHWFRAKFHERYRLFYRFSTKDKAIIYAWIDDEASLRKAGSKTDPYALFQAMLRSGDPPQNVAELLAASSRFRG